MNFQNITANQLTCFNTTYCLLLAYPPLLSSTQDREYGIIRMSNFILINTNLGLLLTSDNTAGTTVMIKHMQVVLLESLEATDNLHVNILKIYDSKLVYVTNALCQFSSTAHVNGFNPTKTDVSYLSTAEASTLKWHYSCLEVDGIK